MGIKIYHLGVAGMGWVWYNRIELSDMVWCEIWFYGLMHVRERSPEREHLQKQHVK